MVTKGIAASVIVATGLLAILLYTTTPTTIGPLGVLIVFILMYIAALGVLSFLLAGGSYAVSKITQSFTVRRPFQAMSIGRAYYFSSVLALGPVMLVGIQSVTGVGVYDALLVVFFVVMACLYISKRT